MTLPKRSESWLDDELSDDNIVVSSMTSWNHNVEPELKVYVGALEYKTGGYANGLLIEAYVDNQRVGYLTAIKLANGEYTADGVEVEPDYRRRGIAFAMTKKAHESVPMLPYVLSENQEYQSDAGLRLAIKEYDMVRTAGPLSLIPLAIEAGTELAAGAGIAGAAGAVADAAPGVAARAAVADVAKNTIENAFGNSAQNPQNFVADSNNGGGGGGGVQLNTIAASKRIALHVKKDVERAAEIGTLLVPGVGEAEGTALAGEAAIGVAERAAPKLLPKILPLVKKVGPVVEKIKPLVQKAKPVVQTVRTIDDVLHLLKDRKQDHSPTSVPGATTTVPMERPDTSPKALNTEQPVPQLETSTKTTEQEEENPVSTEPKTQTQPEESGKGADFKSEVEVPAAEHEEHEEEEPKKTRTRFIPHFFMPGLNAPVLNVMSPGGDMKVFASKADYIVELANELSIQPGLTTWE